jgi:cobalt/nickel transport system permease protein
MLPAWMKETDKSPPPSGGAGRARKSFVGRTIGGVIDFFEGSLASEGYARRRGYLQRLDPRVKLIATLLIVISVTLVSNLLVLACIYLLLIVLAYVSNVSLKYYTKAIWTFIPLFSGIIVLPLLFMAGDPLLHVFTSGGFTLNVTKQGLLFVVSFVARVTTCAAVVVLLVLTTPQESLFRSFRSQGVPKIYVLTLDMAYRYIFLFLDITRDMLTAKKSRTIKSGGTLSEQRWVAGRMGYMLLRTLDMSDKVHKAMISRGFTGDIKVLQPSVAGPADYAALAGAICISALLVLYSQGLIRI